MTTEEAKEPIRLLLVDDHTLFREGIASLIEKAEDIELVGEADEAPEAIRLAGELLPDVVLMDIQMSGQSGIEATRAIVEQSPHIGIVMLTMFEDDESVFAALQAGARGYVLKSADRASLLRTIRAVARGDVLLGPSVARRVIQSFTPRSAESAAAAQKPSDLPPIFARLTPRELEVLRLIAQGLRNREIAEHLVISEKTVGNHISNIFSKLQVNYRSQAILQAYQQGLVKPDS